MDSAAPDTALGIDPLIAEARRRARRRHMFVVAACVIAIAIAASLLTRALRPSPSTSALAEPARLHDAVALGTLVALDRRTAVAKFRISCGWHAKSGRATAKLRPGLYSVALRHADFNVETYPAGPASGVANEVSLSTWERWVGRPGWKGSLSVYAKPSLSDGPTTDICHGVLG